MVVPRSRYRLMLIRGGLLTLAFGMGAFSAHTDATEEPAKEEQSFTSSPAPAGREAVPTTTLDSPSPEEKDTAKLQLSSPRGLFVPASCPMIESQKISGISTFHMDCTEQQMSDEGRAVKITDNFTVSPLLARRFHFWRRVYSLWSKDHYVLHVAAWPEVILEIFENIPAIEGSSDINAASNSGVSRDQLLKSVSESRREEYAKLLRHMHEVQTKPQIFTPDMQRIAKSMEHISEPNKYLTASECLRIQRGQKDFIAQGLRTAPRYLPAIEKEFIGQGVPRELSKLAFIESSFNLKALSKVGASGVFQIMPETGKQYLRIQAGIDERNDPIKAGRAAARLLRFYKESIGSWPLAITAYNHGVGGIRRAMESTGSYRIEDLIVRYEGSGFGFASKNFYTGFLAILATLAQKDVHFPGIVNPAPLRFRIVTLPVTRDIAEIKKQYQMSSEEILRLNPDISPKLIQNQGFLPKKFQLKVSGVPDAQLAKDRSRAESEKK